MIFAKMNFRETKKIVFLFLGKISEDKPKFAKYSFHGGAGSDCLLGSLSYPSSGNGGLTAKGCSMCSLFCGRRWVFGTSLIAASSF